MTELVLTEQERATLKRAAFGAVYLVSNAEPGFLALFKESAAASDALTGADGLVGEIFTSGALPKLPHRSAAEAEAVVLPELRESMAILRAKAPDEAPTYRSTVLSAVERVAAAARGVNPEEAAVLAKVRAALDDQPRPAGGSR
jgi:hypothetical protein